MKLKLTLAALFLLQSIVIVIIVAAISTHPTIDRGPVATVIYSNASRLIVNYELVMAKNGDRLLKLSLFLPFSDHATTLRCYSPQLGCMFNAPEDGGP